MKTLIDCRACGEQISPNAATCPNCGEPTSARTESRKNIAIALFFALLMLGIVIAVVVHKREQAKLDAEYERQIQNLKP